LIPLGDSQRRRRFAWATWALVAANVAAFLWELSLGDQAAFVIAGLAVSPAEVVELADPLRLPIRLIASLFLHAGWIHLLGNMAFLAVFGDDVEERMGGFRYLALYLLSGLVATGAQVAATPHSEVPLVGASGAIAGILGCFLVLFPKARLDGVLPLGCLIVPLRTRAFLFLPGWFLLQLVGIWLEPPGSGSGGVAFYAHLAGFVAGPVLLLFLLPRRGRRRR
jgi:membrane associated rhomboid family serine protease